MRLLSDAHVVIQSILPDQNREVLKYVLKILELVSWKCSLNPRLAPAGTVRILMYVWYLIRLVRV